MKNRIMAQSRKIILMLAVATLAILSGCGEKDTAGQAEIPRDYKVQEQKLMSSMDECWTYVQQHAKGGEPELRRQDNNISIFTSTLNTGAEVVQACANGKERVIYTLAVGTPRGSAEGAPAPDHPNAAE